MSKMSNINLGLQEQAEDLGFSTTQEALDNGYHVVEDLVKGEFTLKKLSIDEQYEQAHEAWLKEKDNLLKSLEYARIHVAELLNSKFVDTVLSDAIKFIEGVSHE